MQNFTIVDLVQTTFAACGFAVFLLPAGCVLGWASNAFGFRRCSVSERLLFSVFYSFAATPVLAVLVTRFFSYKVTLATFLLLAITSIGILAQGHRLQDLSPGRIRRSTWLLFVMALGWFVLVELSLADLQVGHRLYVSYVAFDHSVRVPFVQSASLHGVPPLNPFYGIAHVPVLRYYYYWYVVCALPLRAFGLSAKACLDASVFWSGIGLASAIPLFLKYFLREKSHIRRKSLIGIALLTVTGLDLIPYAIMCLHYRVLAGDMEWWEPNQVASWIGSLLWVPHHVAGLTAGLVGLLALTVIQEKMPFSQRAWAVAIASLAFASAAGLSVYVAFAFAVFAVFWTLWTLRRGEFRSAVTYVVVGVLSVLISYPYLLDLLSKHIAADPVTLTGERFAFFALRSDPALVSYLAHLCDTKSLILLKLLEFPIVAIYYVLEFGFFLVAMLPYVHRGRGGGETPAIQDRMAWALFTVCGLTMSVVHSDSTNVNDLGIRGMLVVQFILLLWAAPVVHDQFFSKDDATLQTGYTGWLKVFLGLTLLIGIAGTTYEVLALRFYPILVDTGKITRSDKFLGSPGFSERTYWLRVGYERLDKLTPPSAMVQYNPVRDEVVMSHLFSTRQAVMGDAFCGSAFGGDSELCRKSFREVAAAFNFPEAVRKWDIDAFCDRYQMRILVATDYDPVWRESSSWVWSRPALISNPSMRAVPCGNAAHMAGVGLLTDRNR